MPSPLPFETEIHALEDRLVGLEPTATSSADKA